MGKNMHVWSVWSLWSAWKALACFLAASTASTASAQTFPLGKCSSKSCDLSPYSLSWTSPEGATPFCFRVTMAPGSCAAESPDPLGCCGKFQKDLNKILLNTSPACLKNASRTVVTVDGVRKGGGVYFDPITGSLAQIRLTNLKLTASDVVAKGPLGITFCVSAPPPCATAEEFCGPRCQYSVFDTTTHMCCPTCDFAPLGTSDSPPTPPTPIVVPKPPPPVRKPPPPVPPVPPVPKPPAPKPVPSSFGTCRCTQCSSCTCE